MKFKYASCFHYRRNAIKDVNFNNTKLFSWRFYSRNLNYLKLNFYDSNIITTENTILACSFTSY